MIRPRPRLRISPFLALGLGLLLAAGAAADAESKLANTLRWKMASEVDNYGFDVYRAQQEDGPFERLTKKPIPGAGSSDVPTEYSYVDDTIAPDTEYFYYVESISMSGRRERFTPVVRVAPKKRPQGSPGGAGG